MSGPRRVRVRSLRTSALLVVLAVVASPLVLLFATNAAESLFVGRTLDRAIEGRDEVAALVRASGDGLAAASDRIDAIAERRDQRVRVLAADGSVVVDRDHLVGDTWLFRVGDFFYGPQRTSVLGSLDAVRGPLGDRPEIAAARSSGHSEACEPSARGNLEICDVAVAVPRSNGAVVIVHVQGSSRRALDALYGSRRQLFKLTGLVLVLALVLWAWMGRQMVRPVESLRDELLARAKAAAPRSDLPIERRDEIGDVAAAFNALMGALAERRKANEAFVADLAHELKNPVASARVCAELLASDAPLDDARRKRLADALGASTARLDVLVTQFLELARAEGGLPGETRGAVDLVGLARALARTLGEGRALEVAVEAPGAPLELRGVESRLESVLRNLMDNAVSFARSRVVVALRPDDDGSVLLTVADDGPGIAPDDLPRMFDRFFTTRGGARGTGLGLALTRAVVEAHGGTIHAESPSGGGARFVVRLPFTPV